jgi:hypothetical protein
MPRNCWEHKHCGREPGGVNADELGVCAAATAESFDGVNRGKNAGRCCWQVAGTLCGGAVRGTFAQKAISCLFCDFFRRVRDEEGQDFQLSRTPSQEAKMTAGCRRTA